jgi:hypothetical protein
LVAYGFGRVFRSDAPFRSVEQLTRFVVTVGGIGFVAGVLWWQASRLARGQGRWMLRSTSRMFAVATMISAPKFVETPLVVWLGVFVSTAVAMGLMFHWTEQWEDRQASAPSAP